MIDFAAALGAISKGLEVLKGIKEIDKSFDAANHKMQIAELTSTLSDLKLTLIESREELSSKDKEIARLKEAFRFREENTVEVRGFRYQKGPDGKPNGMPFCPRCETKDGYLIRLAVTRGKDGSKTICPECKADYGNQHGYGYS